MKKFLLTIILMLMPISLIAGLKVHTGYTIDQYGHVTTSLSFRQGIQYFMDTWTTDWQPVADTITSLGYYFDGDNWDYKSYVPYEFIDLTNSSDKLGDFFKNFVQFFRMVGNFFSNVGIYMFQISQLWWAPIKILMSFGYFMYRAFITGVRLAGYIIGFGYHT